ncbi:polyphosphate kinase 1 [bacterium]|nr:polyphosphate kinase 1 [bacterium]
MIITEQKSDISIDSNEAYLNRELSWLNFARRVLAMAEDPNVPLLERINFAGIVGILHDEFFMKRMSGLKRLIREGINKDSVYGRSPVDQRQACRTEVLNQEALLSKLLKKDIGSELAKDSIPIISFVQLSDEQKKYLQDYFRSSVQPILTPLAVDAEHPFPFISNLGLNLAVQIEGRGPRKRFVRIKVPNNRPRWIPLPQDFGFVPLEQVIAANLPDLFPESKQIEAYYFRVTRGAEGESEEGLDLNYDFEETDFVPGNIIQEVTNELKARRFAGVVRLQVDARMPDQLRYWLARQLEMDQEDVYIENSFLAVGDLMDFRPIAAEALRYPQYEPVTHPRLQGINDETSSEIFRRIRAGDILLHHPYQNFETSVLQFIRAAATDPDVLAIKLTIYRTSSDSPIIKALVEAARLGKQVAVLVEVTARFDEAPNIAWGQLLEKEGVHVAYGVEKLKTHVKLALLIREEHGTIRRYLHTGTGNYHSGTARAYEDLGLLTCDPELCQDASNLFNELTGATAYGSYRKLVVAPQKMRARFTEMIRREVDHAKAGRPCGITAKMNQLQDPEIIRELYLASQAGVPITLNIRGLSCIRPGVPGLSENVRVYSAVGRFLEHSRVYVFINGGEPEYYIGSADWMKRNLNRRVETITPIEDPEIKQQLKIILDTYDVDNESVWDCQPDGSYRRRRPSKGEEPRAVQQLLINMVRNHRYGSGLEDWLR